MHVSVIAPARVAIVASAMAALTLTLPSMAHAKRAVFGGSTNARESIVLIADASMKRLKSAVIAWEADCDDGRKFRTATSLTSVAPTPGFDASGRELLMSRNAKGRFAGTQFVGYDLGDFDAAVTVRLAGRIRSAKATGTLSAEVELYDKASGATAGGCRTDTVDWEAARAPGRIYGGKTSQDEPVVVRVDAKHRRVSDVLTGWATTSCTPEDDFFTFGERFAGFQLAGGKFGHTWGEVYNRDGGGKMHFAYALEGRVGPRSAHGSLHVTITGVDSAGATDVTCDTGRLTWTAAG